MRLEEMRKEPGLHWANEHLTSAHFPFRHDWPYGLITPCHCLGRGPSHPHLRYVWRPDVVQ